jgi:DNA-damage-inducible protein J
MDKGLKEQVEMLFSDMGMNMTTAFTVFAKAVARKGKIPFEVESDPFYSESNMKVLRESIKQADEGKLTPHELIEV